MNHPSAMKTRRVLGLLLGFLRPFARQVALSVLLGVATVSAGIGLLGTSAYLIASAALQPSVAALQVAIVGVRFFGLSRAVFRYLERLVSHSVNFRLLAGLRTWFYRQIEPLAPARLQDARSADLFSRAVADIETLENFYVRAVAPPVVALVTILGLSGFVGRYDFRLAFLLAAALVTGGVGLPALAHTLARRPGQAVVERRAELNAYLLDALQGMPDLLSFGQAGRQIDRIAAAGRSLSLAQERVGRAGALVNALGLLVSGLALWGMLLLSVPLVRSGQISGVSMAVLALVTIASFEAVTPLTQAAQHFESSLQAARRLFALVDARPEVQPPTAGTPAQLPAEPFDLRIQGVSFTYSGRPEAALSNFDLHLPAGKHVALVGASGAGKTTLLNLLLRFWEYSSGAITVNGVDLRRFDPQQVRSRIAVVSQSTYLFSGTLRQNLLLARPGAFPASLEHAIQQAQLAEWVSSLPEGLDTWVGERGVQLSGGERQRLSVARALLRCYPQHAASLEPLASLLLLDEPTAHLDPVTGRRLLQSLRQAAVGRSVIHITHDLGGLEDMDEIIVLQSGRVCERGTHAALLKASGLYAQMCQIQKQTF